MAERSSECYGREQLQALLAAESLEESEETQQLALHLEACVACREALESLSAEQLDVKPLREALRVPPVESRRLSAVIAELSSLETASGKPTDAGHKFAEVQPWIQESDPGSIGRFGEFDLIECVGRGGMGIVFRAFDASLDRPVAVKLMMPALANDPEATQRFFREARSIAAVRHPNVVAVHAVSEVDGLPFLVTEFVEGHSLANWIRPKLPIDVSEIRRIGAEIAAGLQACHQAGVLHRDIKPSNVLLDGPTATAKITDFGLATIANSPSLTVPGQLAGTPGYLAPERLAGAASDRRSDLFSLGCVLYALACGVEPFRSDSPLVTMHQISERDPAPLRSINPRVPADLERTIAALMSKRAEDRPQSASEARDWILGSGGIDVPARRKRSKIVYWTMGSLLLLAAAIGFAIVRPRIAGIAKHDGQYVARSVHELERAVSAAVDGDVIVIDSNEFLETEGFEILNKSITIKAADGTTPTIVLSAEPEHLEPMVHVENGTLTLAGLTLEDDEIESDDFRLLTVAGGKLIASNCRFESNSPGACIGIELRSECRFDSCEFFALDGTGIRWETEDGSELQLVRSQHVGEIAVFLNLEGDGRLAWQQSDVVATNSVVECVLEGGNIHMKVEDCRMQADAAILYIESPAIPRHEFQEQIRWFGRSNHIFAHGVDFTEAEETPEWTRSVSEFAAEDTGSDYARPLFDSELGLISDQLLGGESIESLLK